jgi:hypothetical protein
MTTQARMLNMQLATIWCALTLFTEQTPECQIHESRVDATIWFIGLIRLCFIHLWLHLVRALVSGFCHKLYQ